VLADTLRGLLKEVQVQIDLVCSF